MIKTNFTRILRRFNSMRLVTFKDCEGMRIGAQDKEGHIYDITKTNCKIPKEMKSFFRGGEKTVQLARMAFSSKKNPLEEKFTLCSPIYGSEKILCVGMNYVDHCLEQNLPIPEEPIIFNKFASSIIASGEEIVHSTETKELDFEVELAIVIGKDGKNIKKEEAYSHVGGYTIAHDVSARDWQLKKNGGQWLIGKTFDTFCPLGPCIVTPEDLSATKNMSPEEAVHNLSIRCILNDMPVQDSNTKELIFKIDDIISWISRFMTLRCGDLILTGTPPGVGCFRNPPLWLKVGDQVECEIEGIGSIKNTIASG